MNWTKLNIEEKRFIESIIKNALRFSEVWIDFFCGFGGVTEGIQRTQLTGEGIAVVIACLNHDEKAIGSHKLAHPFCYHITEDIRTAYTDVLKYMVREIRRRSNGRVKVKLWFSHECTHYSIAKGGDSRDADSRSLPEELHRYIDELNPDAVWIENVKEFLTWGPLIQKVDEFERPMWEDDECTIPWMIPDPERKCEYFDIWRDSIIAKGFSYEHRILNCADYGCPTIRKRVFIQFLRKEQIIWAKPTHSKGGEGGLLPWIPIRACLDITDKGLSIFHIKPSGKPRITSRKTFKRIYDGCIHILEPLFEQAVKEHQMLTVYYGNGFNASMEDPANTLTTKDRISLVSTEPFITQYYGSGESVERNRDVNEPAPCITTNPRERVVTPQFITKAYTGDKMNQSVDNPSPTLTTIPHESVVTPQFIHKYYNGDTQNQSLDDPSHALTTVPKLHVVTGQFIDDYHGNGQAKSMDEPSNTLTTKVKHGVVSAEPFLMRTNFDNPPTTIDEPCPVITANRKRHYLINMQFNNMGHSIDVPSPTLISKMDKKPNYLISTEDGIAIEVYESDFPEVVLIKKFMAKWGIGDIYMRELRIPEMLKIHTMRPDLPMIGSVTDQKKFIGNQVPAQIVTELILGSYYGNQN